MSNLNQMQAKLDQIKLASIQRRMELDLVVTTAKYKAHRAELNVLLVKASH